MSIIANTLNAQTVGDLYKQYKAAVEAGDMKTAFMAIKECDKQTDHCPFASAALAVMYDQGYGTNVDSVEAMMGFIGCWNYEFYISKTSQTNGKLADGFKSLGLDIVEEMNKSMQKCRQNYEQYMMLDWKNHACVKAFACRMNAIRNMKYYEESKANGDTEEMLADLESVVKYCLAADSLNADEYSNYLLGKIFYEGLLGFKDKETGLALLNYAGEEGDCISAKVYLAKLDIKKGDIEAAKKKLEDVINTDVLPITPLLMDKCYMLIDPNYDHYDVCQCKQEAIELMKSLGVEVE